MQKVHRHHKKAKALGGGDEPENLIDIDFIEHAEIHARDYIAGGLDFDFRHEGWPFLSKELRDACRAERSRRQSEKVGEKNHMFGRKRPDRSEAWRGDKNPQRKTENLERLRERMLSDANPMRGKSGELNPFYGKKHTDAVCQRLSEINRANPQKPMEGKQHTEESKEKMRGPREKMQGQKWWITATGKTLRSRECPGPEWQQGRKWRSQ
jgi:hypothetical protein